MRRILSPKFFWTLIISLACFPPNGWAQNQAGACGGQPFCVETPDFTATATSFRTSLVGTSRIINVSVRFQNRTAQPLVLGYVASSGITTDERGNRYIVYGGNGFRGIGLVYGNTFDPRFTLRPAGSGDTQFEMHLQATPQNAGQTFTVDLTIDEINNSGGQPTLGGEFPLHFEGLANGVSQGVGSLAVAPDGLANAVSNLKSIFGKKKPVQNAATVASSAASTAAAVNAAANSAASQPSSAPVANTLGQPGSSSTGSQPSTSSPGGATASAPAAVSQNLPAQRPQGSAKAAPQQVATAQPAAEIPNKPGASAAEPWTPPVDASPAAPRVAPIKLEPEKMPDVIGIHLGMDPKEALAILRAHYPKNLFTPYTNNLAIFPQPVFQGVIVNSLDNSSQEMNFITTLPPDRQAVWNVNRITTRMHINRETLLAALRTKYGKESVAFAGGNQAASSDAEIVSMLWLFDESGRHVALPSLSAATTAMGCAGPGTPGSAFLINEAQGNSPFGANAWCATSYVGVHVDIGSTQPIIETVNTVMMDLPLAVRTSHSTAVWYRAQAERARQQDLEKSKQAKPVF
jgi:hypothetical protein